MSMGTHPSLELGLESLNLSIEKIWRLTNRNPAPSPNYSHYSYVKGMTEPLTM